jgi:hypothetical protein
MEHVSKMLLVPSEQYSALLTARQEETKPVVKQLSVVDQQLQTILNDTSLPADVKFVKYQQVLHRYNILKEDYDKPLEVNIKNFQQQQPVEVEENQTVSRRKLPDYILSGIGVKNKKTAEILIDHIERNPEFQFDTSNRLVLDGELVTGSNIIDLVNDFVRDRTKAEPVPGARKFAEALRRTNVPIIAIGNKARVRDFFTNERNPTPTTTPTSTIDSPFATRLGWTDTPRPRSTQRVYTNSNRKLRSKQIGDGRRNFKVRDW